MAANTRVVLPRCLSLDSWSTEVTGSRGDVYTVAHDPRSEVWFSCTCPGYAYHPNKECKHIREVKDQYCGWDALYCDEPQEEDGVCPKCGGPTQMQAHMV